MTTRPTNRLATSAALLLAGVFGVASSSARAQPAAPSKDAPVEGVLPGRPDVAPEAAAVDPAFVSTAAGLSVRPPAGGTMIRAGGKPDEVVRFVSDQAKWTFVVSRLMLAEPVPLATRDAAAGVKQPDGTAAATVAGFADTIAAQMPTDTPGKLLRSDYRPINGYDGAVLASRYTDHGAKRLMQQAIVRRTDKAYYVLTYSTLLTQDDVETDPAANRAVATFDKVIDSVDVLDQDRITEDQTDRLIRTRALMVNWTPAKLRGVLVDQQWLRLQKDGKDIGYTYIVEETASDLPRVGKKDAAADAKANGIRIGVRSRTVPQPGYVVDAESWLWVRYDPDNAKGRDESKLRNRQQQETFRNLMVTTQPDKKGAKPNYAMDVGNSVLRDRIVPTMVDDPSGIGKQMGQRQDAQIDLQVMSTSNLQQLPPITRQLPPYYLPQAMVHLLPRLLPLREPRTYMFASYVPETRQVMTRYVDVLPLTPGVRLGDATVTAIPVRERAGLEGSVTTHYLSPDGKYLGSVNEENHIAILVSDAATIRTIWKDAKLERPADVDDAKP